MEIKGSFTNAIVYNDYVDNDTIKTIYNMCNSEMFKDEKIRIMSDVHYSSACCVVGFTSTFTNKISPSLIGVDIGCGVTCVIIPKEKIKVKLDEFTLLSLDKDIRKIIPIGTNVNNQTNKKNILKLKDLEKFEKLTLKVSDSKTTNKKQDIIKRFYNSLGSLGGGNHFIEICECKENYYFCVHSGSRNFGLQVCYYHKNEAKEVMTKLNGQCNNSNELNYLQNLEDKNYLDNYLDDLVTAQDYANVNRNIILDNILKLLKLDINKFEVINTIHNYIDLESKIIRKGAISAKKNEKVIIPMNSQFGSLICTGKGNNEWNCSAPHGAGRLISRSEAKEKLSIDDFNYDMKDIVTTSVSNKTLDESPRAYKNPNMIIDYIKDTVDIIKIIKPIYNLKD